MATKKAGERLVSEVEGAKPRACGYRFVVDKVLGPDGWGFQVEARGERGGTVASVWGNVDAKSVIGAVFYR